MNKLKRCPFCGAKLTYQFLDYYIHVGENCIMTGMRIKVNDEEEVTQWNTRKQIQNIIDQVDAELESCEKFMREYDDNIAQKAYYSGMKHILQIIKEEGELNV